MFIGLNLPGRDWMADVLENRWRTILVGGFNPNERYEFVSWDYYSQYVEKAKDVPNNQPVYDCCNIFMGSMYKL